VLLKWLRVSFENGQDKEKGPVRKQRALREGMRVRYQLRPGGSSSRASEIRFIGLNVARFLNVELGTVRNSILKMPFNASDN
jgi:hypothetical protein